MTLKLTPHCGAFVKIHSVILYRVRGMGRRADAESSVNQQRKTFASTFRRWVRGDHCILRMHITRTAIDRHFT